MPQLEAECLGQDTLPVPNRLPVTENVCAQTEELVYKISADVLKDLAVRTV